VVERRLLEKLALPKLFVVQSLCLTARSKIVACFPRRGPHRATCLGESLRIQLRQPHL
jgi:hypothetical protein